MANESSLICYWGGFLLNGCTPLELRLNRCSHGCRFCYANLNDGDRRANVKQVMRLLSEAWQVKPDGTWKRTSYTAHLLREGYSVCISNHVDPLAANNAPIALPMMRTMRGMDIPLNIMTRFGKDEHTQEFFDILGDTPTPIYCSLPTLDPEISKRCQPGVPLPDKIIEYVKQAIALGHPVNIGINPIIPGWIDDPEGMAKLFKELGVWGVCLGKIHLSARQLKVMPERDKAALGEDVIKEASAYLKSDRLHDLFMAVKNACKAQGLHVYTAQQGDRSDFFEHEKRLAKKSFPLMQDFVNHCHDNLKDGDLIYFEDFHDFFIDDLPEGVWGLRDHINAMVVPEALYGKYIPQRMDYTELLYHCWKHLETIYCPANVDCFAWAGDPIDRKKNTWTTVVDENELPILVFKSDGTNGQAFTEDHSL